MKSFSFALIVFESRINMLLLSIRSSSSSRIFHISFMISKILFIWLSLKKLIVSVVSCSIQISTYLRQDTEFCIMDSHHRNNLKYLLRSPLSFGYQKNRLQMLLRSPLHHLIWNPHMYLICLF